MTTSNNQSSDHSAQLQLEALLDKLVAVQLDLESIHDGRSCGAHEPQPGSIATAYGLLRSAIADLRMIIQALNGPLLL